MKQYKAGIYLRVSSKHLEENNSIEAQREITKNYAIKHGYQIIKEYEDNRIFWNFRFKTSIRPNDNRYIKRNYKYGNSKRHKQTNS